MRYTSMDTPPCLSQMSRHLEKASYTGGSPFGQGACINSGVIFSPSVVSEGRMPPYGMKPLSRPVPARGRSGYFNELSNEAIS